MQTIRSSAEGAAATTKRARRVAYRRGLGPTTPSLPPTRVIKLKTAQAKSNTSGKARTTVQAQAAYTMR
jgi:hypothetical protein